MASAIDPTGVGFLMAENRSMPMHVGGLQLFRKPEGAGRQYGRELYEHMSSPERVAPLFLKHPHRSARTAGRLVWEEDTQFDIEHHVRHSALPQPGRVRELLDLCGRLHATRLARERPLWESHVIEGLRDGRVAMYTKLHHSLVDGIAAMRLLAGVLSPDPDTRGMPPPWGYLERPAPERPEPDPPDASDLTAQAVRTALDITAEAAGLPGALVRTLGRSLRDESSPVSLYAPRTMLNQQITGSRRFAAQDWPIERLRAVGRSTGTTTNDIVIAMSSGALRSYLLDFDALPAQSLVAMVPVALDARQVHDVSAQGGNAIGSIMVRLGTEHADAGARLRTVHASMTDGKQALASMTPVQILTMSALGQAPAILAPILRMQGLVRPPYNVIISNVPGPRTKQYLNGAELVGTYPLSIPIHGMALNITCTSYDGLICFGLTGCRRTVPHLQRLLGHLDSELAALEEAAGLS